MIVALDGPAASGKGTLARLLARHYGLAHLDTGSLYRAVARDVLARGEDPHDPGAAARAARALDRATLDDPALRSPGIGEAASAVARIPAVRKALVEYQRAFARLPQGAVIDGRDIGTVVCPDADVKIFVVASAAERARRRHAELTEKGDAVTLDQVQEEIAARDARDREREHSPLKPADDAHLLDTTNLDIEAAFKAAVELIDAAIG